MMSFLLSKPLRRGCPVSWLRMFCLLKKEEEKKAATTGHQLPHWWLGGRCCVLSRTHCLLPVVKASVPRYAMTTICRDTFAQFGCCCFLAFVPRNAAIATERRSSADAQGHHKTLLGSYFEKD